MTVRLAIAVALVSLTAVLARGAYGGTAGQWHGAAQLPMMIGGWHGSDAADDQPDAVDWLGADGIVNRTYRSSGGMPVGLYVAYFERQRPGTTIHSPLHCLPGAGWEMMASSIVGYPQAADPPGRPSGRLRRLIARKEGSRAVVLYWYAIHGRMVASELASRAYLIGDRIRFARNDAALVRVVVTSDGDDQAAETRGLAFIDAVTAPLLRLWS
jgi:EpsI family protein